MSSRGAAPWMVPVISGLLTMACTEDTASPPTDAGGVDASAGDTGPTLAACPGPDGCQTVGATECTPGGLRRCLVADGTCAAWSAPSACDDGNLCTVDQCEDGACKATPKDCADGRACTTDGCDRDTGACTHSGAGCPACSTAAECDDDDPCTADACDGGACAWSDQSCDDGDPCTVDTCRADAGCLSTPLACDDGDGCTTDACAAGSCTHVALACEDGNPCTEDACEPGAGCVSSPRDCDDADPCTKDGCAAETGACIHGQITDCGFCSEVADCDDGDACTDEICSGGTCVWSDVACDDGDACTEDLCQPTSGCVYGPLSCDDGDPCTTNTCAPASGCASAPVTCDDDDPCTIDTCLAGYGCAALTPISCNDGDPCTKDFCSPESGCVHAPIVCGPGPAAVTVSGNLVVQVGETSSLVATTENGTDGAYTWSTSAAGVATVEGGVVTGHAPGQAVITAIGQDTSAVGSLPVVVLAVPGVDWTPPFWAEWLESGHGDAASPAFTHWGEGPVPADCASCHSGAGFRDWLGVDGSAAGIVEQPAQPGVVGCTSCHNDGASQLTEVTFPSSQTVTAPGGSARCVSCHKGTSAGAVVDTAIGGAAPHVVAPELTFQSIHARAAAATLYGNDAAGGYEYAGRLYDKKAWHVEGLDTCVGCHEPHSAEVRVELCAGCHAGVASIEDVREIRMPGSAGDFDGDGDKIESMKDELDGMAERLAQALKEYAAQKTSVPLAAGSAPPYFFADEDGDGAVGPTDVPYSTWTPALVRAAYNLAYYWSEPGAYAHNPEYMVQLLHDSTEDLRAGLSQPALESARLDGPHVRGAVMPYRRWYDDGGVHAACSRCHTGAGFVLTSDNGATADFPAENGMACTSCHENAQSFALREVDLIFYPSNVVIGATGPGAALSAEDRVCAFCHTGRLAAWDVDQAIAAGDLHQVVDVHYFPAASVLHGADAAVGYQYPEKTYAPTATHSGGCLDCHAPKATQHSMAIADNAAKCATCHGNTPPEAIRGSSLADYDGDGSAAEPLAGELETLAEALYAQIKAASAATGKPLIYSTEVYPHVFHDTNGDGVGQPGETVYANRYMTWTPELLRGFFNYRMHRTEPGAWAHNFAYMGQLLYDAIEDLGGDVGGFVRP